MKCNKCNKEYDENTYSTCPRCKRRERWKDIIIDTRHEIFILLDALLFFAVMYFVTLVNGFKLPHLFLFIETLIAIIGIIFSWVNIQLPKNGVQLVTRITLLGFSILAIINVIFFVIIGPVVGLFVPLYLVGTVLIVLTIIRIRAV